MMIRGNIAADKDFTGADLSFSFVFTSLVRPNFTRATLRNAYFNDINLRGANFTKADAQMTDFTGSNLTNANLTDARFALTILAQADLSGATLTGVDLSRAIGPRRRLQPRQGHDPGTVRRGRDHRRARGVPAVRSWCAAGSGLVDVR